MMVGFTPRDIRTFFQKIIILRDPGSLGSRQVVFNNANIWMNKQDPDPRVEPKDWAFDG
jgi:hypothetical protein